MKRDFQFQGPWGVLTWLLALAALVFVLTCEAMRPVPAAQPLATEEPYGCGVPLAGEAPTARERAAQFAAQERYYETLDLYGDVEGAVEAARVVYGMDVMTHAEG